MNWKPIVVFVLGSAVGFLLMGNGPVGKLLWPPADTPAEPATGTLAALMVVGFIEVLAFGLGVTFLAFGLKHVQNLTMTRGGYAVAVWLAIAWMLVNWVPHTALHMSVGNLLTPSDFNGLAAIEYGFHLTLIVAGAILMHACYRTTRTLKPTAATAPTAAATRAR
jgi:hypothetical protein